MARRNVEKIFVTPFIDSIVCGDNVATGGHAWDFEGVAKELFRATKKGWLE